MTQKFKDYVVEPIPDNWIVDKIGRLLLKEFSGTWGPEDAHGINVLRSTNFQDNGYLNLDSVAVREIGENYPSEKRVYVGDILLERSGGGPQQPVGRVSWCDDKVISWAFSNFCQLLRPSVKVDDKFLFFALYYLHIRTITLTYQNQTTGIRNLEYKSYLKIPILLPPLPEQSKIAEILSTVDEAIEKTGAIIQETLQLKKGLMQKLFTEGIGHTRFKETEIGRKPEEWEIARMVNITKQFISGGTPETSIAEYWNGDIPWITGVFVTERTVHKGEKYITSQGLEHSATHIVPKGGLLLVTRTNVGNVAVAGTDIAISQDLTGIVLDETQAESGFIVWYLLQNSQNLTRLQQGTTIQGIIRKDVEKVLVALPSLAEQRKIAEILSEVDTKIETEQTYKSELERLKKGLMQVLLTGRVRVKV